MFVHVRSTTFRQNLRAFSITPAVYLHFSNRVAAFSGPAANTPRF